MMVKKLTKHGNSMALLIEKPVLELIGADADTPFEITTDGKSLTLKPVTDKARKKKFDDALQQVNKRYSKTLKKLAE